MSVDYLPVPRMPQPEQWMSEHPLVVLALVVIVLVLVLLFAGGVSRL